jgi:hypothetical protein
LYPWENIQPTILVVSYILPKALSPSWESPLVSCLRKVPVTPTQPLGCPDHQSSTWLPTLASAQVTWYSLMLIWAPFLTLPMSFQFLDPS